MINAQTRFGVYERKGRENVISVGCLTTFLKDIKISLNFCRDEFLIEQNAIMLIKFRKIIAYLLQHIFI